MLVEEAVCTQSGGDGSPSGTAQEQHSTASVTGLRQVAKREKSAASQELCCAPQSTAKLVRHVSDWHLSAMLAIFISVVQQLATRSA